MGVLSGWPGYVCLALLILGFSWMSYSPNVPEWAGERFLLQCYVSSMRIAILVVRGTDCVPVVLEQLFLCQKGSF